MVPKEGLEPSRRESTAPSRLRVYQFHHFGRYCGLSDYNVSD